MNAVARLLRERCAFDLRAIPPDKAGRSDPGKREKIDESIPRKGAPEDLIGFYTNSVGVCQDFRDHGRPP